MSQLVVRQQLTQLLRQVLMRDLHLVAELRAGGSGVQGKHGMEERTARILTTVLVFMHLCVHLGPSQGTVRAARRA